MKNIFLTLLFLLFVPALVLGQSAKATRNLEKLTFDGTNQLKTVGSGGGGGAVTNAGTFAVQVDGATLTALQIIDNMISGSGINVSQIGGVAPSMNTGLRDAGTIRVTVSTNDLVPISAASLPLPAGAATSANQLADGHNVTVDNASIAITVASLPLPAGASTSALQLPDGHNVTVDNASIAITAAALPLPAGAATNAAQLADGHNVALSTASDVTMQLEDVDVAEANPMPIRLSDGTNFVDAAILGTTTYSETVTKGSVIGFVRNFPLAPLANTDNEIAPGQVDPDGAVYTTGGKHYGVLELGLTELIGVNEIVSADSLSDEVAVTFTGTGEIRKICIFTDESGATGTVYSPSGTLYLFDVDPTVTLNDAAFAADEHTTVHATFTFAAADWIADALGAVNCQDTNEVFSNGVMFAVWRLGTGEVEVNTTATDDEVTQVNFWYKRDS